MASLRTVAPQKKYGLVSKKKTAAPLQRPNIFGGGGGGDDDSDADEDGGAAAAAAASKQNDVHRVNRLLMQKSAAAEREQQKMYDDALGQDSSIFDYDGVYDDMKAASSSSSSSSSSALSSASSAKDKDAPKARYINNLMTTASIREKEKERIFERKLLKERKVEDEEFGDKPKFVTAAYKQKLMETQKWEYEDKLTDEIEMRTDVRSRGMEGFYANLLTKNVAMGGDVEKSALSAYTAGSHRQMMQVGGSDAPSSSSAAPPATAAGSDPRRDVVVDDPVSAKRTHPAGEDDDRDGSGAGAGAAAADGGDAPPPSKAPRVDTEDAPPPAEPLSKEAQVALARQRFLERKLAQQAKGDP